MASREIRPIRVEGNIAYVTLTRGYEAVIDAVDVPLVDGFNWYAHEALRSDGTLRTVYAIRDATDRRGRRKRVALHRIISGYSTLDVDHKDGDGLNNCRSNLRAATRAQNIHNASIRCTNKSGVKGVHWAKEKGKWRAQIRCNGARKTLGYFNCRTAAAIAYANESRRLHGEFARIA